MITFTKIEDIDNIINMYKKQMENIINLKRCAYQMLINKYIRNGRFRFQADDLNAERALMILQNHDEFLENGEIMKTNDLMNLIKIKFRTNYIYIENN